MGNGNPINENLKSLAGKWKMLLVIFLVIGFVICAAFDTFKSNNTNPVKKKDSFAPGVSNGIPSKSKEELYHDKKNKKHVKDDSYDDMGNETPKPSATKNEDQNEENGNNVNDKKTNQPVNKSSNNKNSTKPSKKNNYQSNNINTSNKPFTENKPSTTDSSFHFLPLPPPKPHNGTTWKKDPNADNTPKNGSNIFKATVFGDQTFTGSQGICKIRLLEDHDFGDVQLPKNTILTASVSRTTDFINMQVTDILYNNSLIKTNYILYTNSGKGIYHKASLSRSNFKSGAGQVISTIGESAPVAGSGILTHAGQAMSSSAQQSAQQGILQDAVTIQDGYNLTFIKQ